MELQQAHFTQQFTDDTIFATYNNWEEIPVSNLTFNSKSSQICYIALSNQEATKAIKTQAIPINTKAYEYKDEIKLKTDEVILAVEIDTTNLLDLTHKSDYMYFMQCILNNTKIDNVALIRKTEISNDINHIRIVYIIKNNSSVKHVIKI